MKKWFISGLVVVALLATTGLLIKKSVRAEIVINASQKEVWSVITNPATYGDWNPIFVDYERHFR